MQGLNLGDEVISCGEVISEREMNRIYEISRMAPFPIVGSVMFFMTKVSTTAIFVLVGSLLLSGNFPQEGDTW